MSKTEELSRQYVLPFLDKEYEKYGEYRQMTLSKFDGCDMMSAYEEGYHQAEKDLANTKEETLEKVCEWLKENASDYIVLPLPQINATLMAKDLKKHLEDKV